MCKCSDRLVGKVVIITGSNTGIGFEIAKDMAERGARVILACRNETRAMEAINEIRNQTHNENIHYSHLDLASISSVKKFVSKFINEEERLDILVNNAGVITRSDEKTEDGFSMMIQSNYLGHFLLTVLLLPLLMSSAPSRIINFSSVTHKFVNIHPDDLCTVPIRKSYTNSIWYFKTKLCMVLMTKELARRLKDTGVTVNCLHPGAVKTNMINNIDIKFVKIIVNAALSCFKTPRDGAETAIYLAVSPEVENHSGGYYVDCKLANTSRRARNPDLARQLWEASERLVGVECKYY
ncbi:retinol dehydrogenase 14-like [Pieris rapae]|uniref:retinol dehydrogenase 14-like n=1 Tax=Pieris rapae TaxID=64459 RepID=UPI001E27DAAB|nr:retinol dehydrogenase 14-like [Pieris rapae]